MIARWPREWLRLLKNLPETSVRFVILSLALAPPHPGLMYLVQFRRTMISRTGVNARTRYRWHRAIVLPSGSSSAASSSASDQRVPALTETAVGEGTVLGALSVSTIVLGLVTLGGLDSSLRSFRATLVRVLRSQSTGIVGHPLLVGHTRWWHALEPDRVLATILITDIVSSIQQARNLSIGLRHRVREITDASRLTRLERRSSVAVD